MENQKKILTRVQLINWHYFENERIAFSGSTLVSGENTAGKSTILDAIQMVLTTNTRRFNAAANEKGNRNLKGYIRCKVGNVGETYLRKNAVPANAALEFYEEKGDRYFVIGAHMLSPDEESDVIIRWYIEECRLEELSFIVDGHAALAEEFRAKNRKVNYIDHKNAAKDRFKRRLGNLDDKFFDIIPKSLAFKPMDNVKQFINKFVLSEARIDVGSLRENIETLSELENVLECSRRQQAALEKILDKYEEIEAKDREILVNDILLKIASCDAVRENIDNLEKQIRMKEQTLQSDMALSCDAEKQIRELETQILAIKLDIKENESNRLIENVKSRIDQLNGDIEVNKGYYANLTNQIDLLKKYLNDLIKLDYKPITGIEADRLKESEGIEDKAEIVEKFDAFSRKELIGIQDERSELLSRQRQLDDKINECQLRLKNLGKKIFTYPAYAEKLKKLIEKEFVRRGIRTSVYFLSELLEITDFVWSNAVEGYLNTQKFYLVVEPEYYDIALEVYKRNNADIHTAGIINSRKLPINQEPDKDSLAYVIKSDNRYAKAYAGYILGRVRRCADIHEMENYPIAITPDCMLYQGYVVRHLNPDDYRNPFIGQNAYRVQIENTKKEIEDNSTQRRTVREKLQLYNNVQKSAGKVNSGLIKLYMHAPETLSKLRLQLAQAEAELKEAQKNPEWIEKNDKLQKKEEVREKENLKKAEIDKEIGRLQEQLDTAKKDVIQKKEEHARLQGELDRLSDEAGLVYKEANEKYSLNRKSKNAKTIADNFAPRKTQLLNEKEKLLNEKGGLNALQMGFNQDFAMDFATGLTGISEYREALQKLKSVEIIKYEEKLKSAKDDCEQIFRSDFLSKMKENIESARNEFRSLNKALDNIYYGDDSYHFKISFDKNKEGLYKMITSENNYGGTNLWTSAFEDEYREEMSDLFDKLMTKDDKGQKIVEEYTDYRSYLDYDIEIHKRDGSIQRFSDIYGEKSGSETQVPYYVAIAASFYQLYRYGNSVRLMLLDEAFDKMDDERIQSMMDFFNSLELQVILATPPAKIEVIGEKVQTVLTAIRVGQSSIVEEYDL